MLFDFYTTMLLISQFRSIKIQPKTIDLSIRGAGESLQSLWGLFPGGLLCQVEF